MPLRRARTTAASCGMPAFPSQGMVLFWISENGTVAYNAIQRMLVELRFPGEG
jgi:hypothetical protein